ncbi:MAG: MmgE/PrpD family protein [Porphyrobacter sp.]|nr:MmgE/PrpD family protein [Porphyrobacter sp.]
MSALSQATADLLDFAGARHVLPAAVRADAVRLLGDTLAVGAAGVDAPGEAAIRAAARAMGSGDEARLLGTAESLPAPAAAFVNGYRIHCLEWDAVHEPAVVHAMSVVTAALGAVIDRRGGCDPDDALTALAIGVDVASGLGLAATSGLTFFRPATAGVVGAALAAARIDGAPLDDALGLAVASAAGTMQAHVEGLVTLPFQIANAARAAVAASDLAKAGFPGPKDPLEGPFGYFALFDHGDLARYTADLGHLWRISEISVKPFASGRASHAALGALAELRPDPAEVARIELACPPLIHRLVGRPYAPDMTPAYARLCLPFLAALMLTDGRIDPRRFTPQGFADPALGALAGRVQLVPDGNTDPNALFPQSLTITLADGTRLHQPIAATFGSPANPLTAAEAAAKLALCRERAPPAADPRLFTDPLSYFTGTP